MSLDLEKLEHVRQAGGGRYRARCPVCAEGGGDKSGNHLFIWEDGRYACAAQQGDEAHRKRIFALAGAKSSTIPPVKVTRPAAAPMPQQQQQPRAIKWPQDMHPGTENELYTVADVRELPGLAGLELATKASHLWFADLADTNGPDGAPSGWTRRPAWFLTDSARKILLARRLDGEQWNYVQAKAWSRGGSDSKWPIGAPDIGDRPTVAIVEGGPDFLALCHLIAVENRHEVAPVCMPASCDINPDALPFFAGRDVLIFADNDDAGRKARNNWTRQLTGAGAKSVGWFDFSGYVDRIAMRPVKDLNELVTAIAADRITKSRPVPDGLCPECWAVGVAAPIGGQTCQERHSQ